MHLAVACALGDVKEVLQQVGLLLLKQLQAGRVEVRTDGLVSVEGANVHLAHLQDKPSFCQKVTFGEPLVWHTIQKYADGN